MVRDPHRAEDPHGAVEHPHLKGLPGISGFYDFEATPQRGLGVSNTLVSRWNAASKHWEAVSGLSGLPIEK